MARHTLKCNSKCCIVKAKLIVEVALAMLETCKTVAHSDLANLSTHSHIVTTGTLYGR